MSKTKIRAVFDERLRRLLWRLKTWGERERAAGVTDRLAFWKGKTESEASAELRRLIAERLRKGEIA